MSGRRRGGASAATALLAVAVSACGDDPPLQPGPCEVTGMPVELARAPDGLSSLRAAGDAVVFVERRGRDFPNEVHGIRRVDRDGTALDLVTLPRDDAGATLLATGDEVFWGGLERGMIIRRLDVKSVPLAGGPTRTLGLVQLDWADDGSRLLLAAEPFAADERAVYFTARQLGAGSIEVRIYAMARADGALSLRAITLLEAHDVQLVGGQIWWRDGNDDNRLHRVPAAGPPAVESLTVAAGCRDLLVTAAHGLFCGDDATLTRLDRDGGNPRLILHAPSDTGGGSRLVPLAVEGDWLWLHEEVGGRGHLRKLHLGEGRLQDVVCNRVSTRPVLTARDVVWKEATAGGLDPAAAVVRQPR